MYLSGDSTVNITGGTFNGETSNYVVSLPYKDADVKLNISGGTFNSSQDGIFYYRNVAVSVNENENSPTVKITGGKFNGANLVVGDSDNKKLTISNGLFSAAPAAGYLVTGFKCNDKGEGVTSYRYEVVKNVPEGAPQNVVVTEEKPVVTVKDDVIVNTSLSEPEKTALKEALQTTAEEVKAAELTTIVNDVPVTAATATTAVEKLNDMLRTSPGSPEEVGAEDVKIVVVPFLDVEVKEYNTAANVLTLNIEPMYQIKATTVDDLEAMKEEGTNQNTVDLLDEPQKLEIKNNEPVTISFPLPNDFPVVNPDNFFIKHVKDDGTTYYYKATVSNTTPRIVTFINTHGFSLFSTLEDTRTGTINFTGSATASKVFKITDLNTKLPDPTNTTYFGGWRINGNVYTTLTDELLTALNIAPEKTLTATAVYNTPGISGIVKDTTTAGTVADTTTTTTVAAEYTVNASRLNLRSAPVNGTVVAQVKRGAALTVLSIENGWAKVEYNGATLYASMGYLLKTGAVTGTVIISYRTLNVRAGASTQTRKLGKLTRGTSVDVLSVNNGWGEISMNGVKGYICMKYTLAK